LLEEELEPVGHVLAVGGERTRLGQDQPDLDRAFLGPPWVEGHEQSNHDHDQGDGREPAHGAPPRGDGRAGQATDRAAASNTSALGTFLRPGGPWVAPSTFVQRTMPSRSRRNCPLSCPACFSCSRWSTADGWKFWILSSAAAASSTGSAVVNSPVGLIRVAPSAASVSGVIASLGMPYA